MRHKLVFLKFGVLLTVILYVLPPVESQAQRNASHKAEKELFGKSRKGKPPNDKIKAKGAAGKAMKEQAKKEARREKEDEKNIEKLRKRHIEIQTTVTQERMVNNGKETEANYKAKKQKQRQEQTKPKLQKPKQPIQRKEQTKAKMQDPKKQPKLKQYKIKKYSS